MKLVEIYTVFEGKSKEFDGRETICVTTTIQTDLSIDELRALDPEDLDELVDAGTDDIDVCSLLKINSSRIDDIQYA